MNVPATMVWIDWPIQTRLRSQNFLLLLLLLGEAALTYSPRRVLWTGAWIMGVWSLAFAVLYSLPDSVRYGDIIAQGTDEGLLALFLSPTYVSLPMAGADRLHSHPDRAAGDRRPPQPRTPSGTCARRNPPR